MDKKTDRRVFDVAKPGSSEVEIGSKPMIVGHKSMATDPMMRTDNDSKNQKVANDRSDVHMSKVAIAPITIKTNEAEPEAPLETVDKLEPSEAESVSQEDFTDTADESTDSVSSRGNDKGTEGADGKKVRQIDPDVVAMERAENLQRLIDTKKYRLDIKESSAGSGGMKKYLIVLAVVIVGLMGLFIAIDTNIIDIGIELPISVF